MRGLAATARDVRAPAASPARRTAVFLIHPRDHRDLVARFPLARFVPSAVTDPVMLRLRGRLGHALCESAIALDGVEVHLVAVLLKARQIVSGGAEDMRRARRRILASALHAQDVLGADVIGLGALTASATAGGRSLVDAAPLTASVTHGDAYTMRIALQGIERAVRLSGLRGPRIAIVGAAGLIGSSLARQLAGSSELILVGRTARKLDRLREELGAGITTSTDLGDLAAADLVVTATSHPSALLAPGHLRRGAIVYDLAQPGNADPSLVQARPDVVRIDGGLVSTPGMALRFDMKTPAGATFACLAETVLMAQAGIRGHRVDDIDFEHARRVEKVGHGLGFAHAPFTQFGRPVPDEALARPS